MITIEWPGANVPLDYCRTEGEIWAKVLSVCIYFHFTENLSPWNNVVTKHAKIKTFNILGTECQHVQGMKK